jgi:hypothetical protein
MRTRVAAGEKSGALGALLGAILSGTGMTIGRKHIERVADLENKAVTRALQAQRLTNARAVEAARLAKTATAPTVDPVQAWAAEHGVDPSRLGQAAVEAPRAPVNYAPMSETVPNPLDIPTAIRNQTITMTPAGAQRGPNMPAESFAPQPVAPVASPLKADIDALIASLKTKPAPIKPATLIPIQEGSGLLPQDFYASTPDLRDLLKHVDPDYAAAIRRELARRAAL